MTLGAVAGVLMTTAAGAWVDASTHKRALVVIPGVCTVLASGVILASQAFWPIALSQVATAVAGAAIVPAVTGITLGMFRQTGFNRQNGLNQAYNHAGNAVGAGLSGLLGWKLGMPAVFWLAVAFAVASIIAVASIPAKSIDHLAARGFGGGAAEATACSGISVLLTCKPLLLLAIALMFFHLGNAAMLPLYGRRLPDQELGRVSRADPGRHRAGLQSVAVPGLVARILDGTGRINIGQGAVMTAQGVGAALSPAIGGWLAQWSSYGTAFILLGGMATGSLVIWIAFSAALQPSCIVRQPPGRASLPATSTEAS